MDVSPEEKVKLSEMPLPGGKGLLIEDFNEHQKSERFTIALGTQDRLYSVSGPTLEACQGLARLLR